MIARLFELELIVKSNPAIAGYRVPTLIIRLESYGEELLDQLDAIQDTAEPFLTRQEERMLVTTDFAAMG